MKKPKTNQLYLYSRLSFAKVFMMFNGRLSMMLYAGVVSKAKIKEKTKHERKGGTLRMPRKYGPLKSKVSKL